MFTVSVVTQGFAKKALKTLFCADLYFRLHIKQGTVHL